MPLCSQLLLLEQVTADVWQNLPEPSTLSISHTGSFYHSMRAELMRCAHMPASVLVDTMSAHACALRKSGRSVEASQVVLDIHSMLAGDLGGLERQGGSQTSTGAVWGLQRVGLWWRVEEAKLLWATGKPKLAGKLLEEVEGSLNPEQDPGAGSHFASISTELSNQCIGHVMTCAECLNSSMVKFPFCLDVRATI